MLYCFGWGAGKRSVEMSYNLSRLQRGLCQKSGKGRTHVPRRGSGVPVAGLVGAQEVDFLFVEVFK